MARVVNLKFERARRIAAECAVRVKARRDYASDNQFAVAARHEDAKVCVQNILSKRVRPWSEVWRA